MAIVKQKRNDPCSCGSGKKAKKCCILENKKTVAIIKELRQSSQNPVNVVTNEIMAAIGGSFSFQQPDEPAIGPPRWAAWGLVAFAVVPIIVAFAFILKG